METKDTGLWRTPPQEKASGDRRDGPSRPGVSYIPLCPGTVVCITDTDQTSYVDEIPLGVKQADADFSNHDGMIPSGTWKKVKDMLALQKRFVLLSKQNKAP